MRTKKTGVVALLVMVFCLGLLWGLGIQDEDEADG